MSGAATKNPFQSAQDDNIIQPLIQINPKAFRLEIDEFLADNAMTNLFLLALEAMQQNSLATPESGKPNWWSFYSLGGIHGLPREKWAGYENKAKYGYCHHGMNTFPTWHRPYMFQFEQAVYNQMATVARQYTNDDQRKVYTEALSRFRLPYWDVCMPRHEKPSDSTIKVQRGNAWRWGFPKILKAQEVYVRRPGSPDELKPIANPLWRFKFPESKDFNELSQPRPQIKWKEASLGWKKKSDGTWEYNQDKYHADFTTRAPTEVAKGDSDYEFLEQSIQLQTQAVATNIWHMLNPEEPGQSMVSGKQAMVNQWRPWNLFANHSQSSQEFATQSLESWHDNIHNLVGTGIWYQGHMSDPAVAAFDPVFWMHHNNIDRLFAIYQALFPDKYVDPGKRAEQRPALLKEDPTVFADDQLFPFKKNKDGTCWTSTEIRDWKATGFAVPGNQKLDAKGTKALAQYLRDTYYWATNAAEPPRTLDWPKNLSHVEALTGKSEALAPRPAIAMKAISVQDGIAQLVTRTVQPVNNAIVKEQVLDAKAGAESLAENERALPTSALIDADKATVRTKMRTWNAHLRVRKYAYDSSFNIHFFIGHVKDTQPERYMTKMNEVGFSGIFASSERSNCASCALNRDADLMYEDVVPLTGKLMDYLASNPGSGDLIRDGVKTTIESLEAEEVVPFLKEHLQWRITDAASNLLDGVEQSGLEVKVADRLFEPPQGDNLLGTYGPSTVHLEITQGKTGGFSG